MNQKGSNNLPKNTKLLPRPIVEQQLLDSLMWPCGTHKWALYSMSVFCDAYSSSPTNLLHMISLVEMLKGIWSSWQVRVYQ